MKYARLLPLACLLALAGAAPQDQPINKTCPMMKGKPVKSSITSTYNGKTVGFC